MFVYNDVVHDSRVRREAASMAQAGHAVTVIGRRGRDPDGPPAREKREGYEIVRVGVPQGWRFWWTWAVHPWRMRSWFAMRARRALGQLPRGLLDLAGLVVAAVVTVAWAVVRAPFEAGASRRPPTPGGSTLDALVRWRWGVGGWARAAAAAAGRADAYHGHDMHGLLAAVVASHLHASVPVVYDSHEIFVDAGSNATRPKWFRRLFLAQERRLAVQSDALVTVNDAMASELTQRLRPSRVVVVYNCPPRWTPPSPRPDLLRQATGIPPGSPVVLYHGGLIAARGLEQIAEAMLVPGLEHVHAVYLGYGALRELLETMARDPRYEHRLHVLPAVPPEGLSAWIASADIGVMPLQHAATLNHRFATPNKLFECLGAGVPVVASDLPEMQRIVAGSATSEPLGAICDPADPSDIARGIRTILDLPPAARIELQSRCLSAAHDRWNWETQVEPLLALYASFDPMQHGSRRRGGTCR